jgi:putative hydrolase of HD superfamily
MSIDDRYGVVFAGRYNVGIVMRGTVMNERIIQQLQFAVELDKLKLVLRRTSPIGAERRENSAEHSWQVILCAMLLHEHSNEPVDLLRVMQMLAIHDTVEIDVGDTFHYEKQDDPDLTRKEAAAAERIFSMLPPDQGQYYRALWQEFEERSSPEARYAAAIDRAIGFLMNINNDGGTWKKHNLSPDRILSANSHIAAGSEELWRWINETVQRAVELKYIS